MVFGQNASRSWLPGLTSPVRRLSGLAEHRPPVTVSRTADLLQLPENLTDGGILRATVVRLCSGTGEEKESKPNADTYASLLRQCAGCKALDLGQLLHEHIVKRRFDGDTYLGNLIVQMYGSCGEADSAGRAFEKIEKRNVFSWNSLLAAYAQNGHLLEGRYIFELFPEPNVVSWNTMVAAHAQHGGVIEARNFFDQIPEKDLVSYNSMIAGYAQNGYSSEALQLFKAMDLEGVETNKVTFVSVLDACGNLGALKEGTVVYNRVVDIGCKADTAIATALINMFGKCGQLRKAREIFQHKMLQRNAITWTTIVSVHAQNGHLEEAKKLFDTVPRPLAITWNVLLAGYAQIGHFTEVRNLFDMMKQRDDASWATVIGAYIQSDKLQLGMDVFKEMDLEGFKPTKFTYMNILDACGRLSALREGRLVHESLLNSALRSDVLLQNGLVHMYSKCGSLEEASRTFERMPQRDSVSWSIMISAFAQSGHGEEALQQFLRMKLEGANPDETTFVSILSVCAHSGMLYDGRNNFLEMSRDFGINPTIDHYVCLVDLLCRSGKLEDAEDLIQMMPLEPDRTAFITLLAACKMQGDLQRGARVGHEVLKLDPDSSAPYALLSDIYAVAKRINEVTSVRKALEERGIQKQAGCSYIEVQDKVHEFRAGESSHPRFKEIVYELIRVFKKMAEPGVVADTKVVSYDLEEEEKENVMAYHSEKLAIGLGLISTRPGTPLRIAKDLRVCSECHSAIKFISRVTKRRIVVRDCNRFHQFESGTCSCRDYW